MFINLDEGQRQAVNQLLKKLDLEDYKDEVEMVMLGDSNPQTALDLLTCFYLEGEQKARKILNEAFNNYMRKLMK